LTNAIRKLSAINTVEAATAGASKEDGQGKEGGEGEGKPNLPAERLLYRGVSGKLADSFFEPDAQGLIAAVDTGIQCRDWLVG
jgi:hypothetical protein